MTRRHARAIAVFTIVLITLTGARRSHGGGCDDDNDSSSSTTTTSGGSSSGGSTYDDDLAAPDTATPTSGSTPGAISSGNAIGDVRVDTCTYDKASQQFRSDLTVTNTSSTESYKYRILVKVEDTGANSGTLLSADSVTLDNLAPGQTQKVTSIGFRPLHGDEGTTFKCTIDRASKYPLS